MNTSDHILLYIHPNNFQNNFQSTQMSMSDYILLNILLNIQNYNLASLLLFLTWEYLTKLLRLKSAERPWQPS